MTEKRESRKGDWLASWHVNPSLNKDYDVIDGLRGIAILMVVAGHLFYFNPNAGPVVRYIGNLIAGGGAGVTLFFTLSGFLISHPFWKRKIQGAESVVPRGYAGRRFWKIYPPYALSILLLAPIYFLFSGDAGIFLRAGHWLAGWPLVAPVKGGLDTVNTVMWSLIVEVHFYIVLPLLFLALKRVPVKASMGIVFLVFLVVPPLCRWLMGGGPAIQLTPVLYVRFPSVMESFAFGTLLAGLENLGRVRPSWARWGDAGVLLFLAVLAVGAWWGLHGPLSPLQIGAFEWGAKIASAMMLCYVANPHYRHTRWLSSPWLRWFGLISYEWYLFHQPMIVWSRGIFGNAEGDILKYSAVVGGALIAGLVLSVLVYRCFSLPILKFGRSRHAAR